MASKSNERLEWKKKGSLRGGPWRLSSSSNLILNRCRIAPTDELLPRESFARKWNRRIVHFLGAPLFMTGSYCEKEQSQTRRRRQFSLLNEIGGGERDESHAGTFVRGMKLLSWKKKMKKLKENSNSRWLPKVILCLFFLFVGHLLAVLYYQYSYDFDLLRLRQMQQTTHTIIVLTSQSSIAYQPISMIQSNYTTTNLLTINSDGNGNNRGSISNGMNLEAATANRVIARMNQAEHRLRQLSGTVYAHLTIIAECLYLSMIAFACAIYLSVVLIHHFLKPYNFYIVRELINPKLELDNMRRQIESQISRFIVFNRAYLLMIMGDEYGLDEYEELSSGLSTGNNNQQLGLKHGASTSLKPTTTRDVALATIANTVRLRKQVMWLNRHGRQLNRSLNHWLVTGALTPLNMLNKWVMRRSNLQLIFHIFMALFALVFDMFFIGYSLSLATSQEENFGLIDSLSALSCLGLLVINLFSFSFHGPIHFITSLDQIEYAKQLDTLIRRCIDQNRRLFFAPFDTTYNYHNGYPINIRTNQRCSGTTFRRFLSLRQQRQQQQQQQWHVARSRSLVLAASKKMCPRPSSTIQASDENMIELMNSNYRFVLLHYEMFANQLRPIKSALGPDILISLVVLFIIPIVICLHLYYIFKINDNINGDGGPRSSNERVRQYALGLSSTVLIPANLILVPLCYLNRRCQDLYKSLSSLRAHIIEVESFGWYRQGVYDKHAVSVLSKKLAHPQQFLDEFVINWAGLWGTYTTLIKAHFWWGLLALSIIIDRSQADGKREDIFRFLFNDPFGVL